jgi:hypothetical protein
MLTLTYNNSTSQEYGGYTNDALQNNPIKYEVAMSSTNSSTFTQAETITLRYAGTYTTKLTFTVNGTSVQVVFTVNGKDDKNTTSTIDLKNVLPVFTVSSVTPTVTIDSISPSGKHTSINSSGTQVNVTSGINTQTNTITIYPKGTVTDNGCTKSYNLTEEPKVYLNFNGMGNADNATLTFTESTGGTVRMYYGSSSKGGTRTDSFVWSKGGAIKVMRFVGYNDGGSCNDSEVAGTLTSNSTLVMSYGEESFNVTVKVITIINKAP